MKVYLCVIEGPDDDCNLVFAAARSWVGRDSDFTLAQKQSGFTNACTFSGSSVLLGNVRARMRPTEGSPEMHVFGLNPTASEPRQQRHFRFFFDGVGISADFCTQKGGVARLVILSVLSQSQAVFYSFEGPDDDCTLVLAAAVSGGGGECDLVWPKTSVNGVFLTILAKPASVLSK